MKSINWDKSAVPVRTSTVAVRSPRGQPEVRQERQEIREYLEKLRQLVPACPKAGKVSRLAVIQHVIDYIVELQDTLVHHPVNTILAANHLTALHDNPLLPLQHLDDNTNKTSFPATSTPTETSISKNNSNTNKNSRTSTNKKTSSCRRPLGVLSSLKNHRNQ
ncbi:DNA-binding protein inhibitor ID-2-A-like [Homarus americanus]|uniref:Extra-macrochaetae-like 2 n=1 Tax=Homarus americanus TaxID=6706 RepID=A0A8J5MS15_HOMAM|nr:DNA-binding protein inhibitor ID-2-A-like [Homarus americanus]KAG7161479.1 extra-macrochaetae-like 2 [Homarus americanus]